MQLTSEQLKAAFSPVQAAAIESWISTFYGFQREWLLDQRRFAALVKCRQIGGSHTFAAWPVLRALWGESCILVSRAETEAIDLLATAAKHASALASLGVDWAQITERSQLQISLESGAIIRATTSRAAGRGFSGNVILDEFAYHERQQDVWDAALAATTHGYSCRILSTPNGVGDIWHELCCDIGHQQNSNDDGWLVYQTTIDDAIAAGMRIDLVKAWTMARNDPRVFDQLFRCKFIDNDTQYLPSELIARQTTDYSCTDLTDNTDQCVAGLDIGEKRDRTCLLVLRGYRNSWKVSHIETHQKTDAALLEHLISQAINVYGAQRIAIDATGMGTFPARSAKRRHGARVEPVTFTNSVKEELASSLYEALVSGTLELPKRLNEASELRDDLSSIRRIVTTAGNVRFDAPRTTRGHADRAWSLMLALHATSRAASSGAYARLKALKGGRNSGPLPEPYPRERPVNN